MTSRLTGLLLGAALAAAFYMALIDTVDLPELYAGGGGLVLAVGLYEAARHQRHEEASVRLRWLGRGARVAASVPAHIGYLLVEAARQLADPQLTRGEFRAVRFDSGGNGARDRGRRALAEAVGSLAPNTIVVGVDSERDILLVHQLRRTGGREALDPLELG